MTVRSDGEHRSRSLHFLVMELIEGEDLFDRISRGPISVEETLPIALQIAQALESAHQRGIVHRDLKPSDIKIDTDGQVKVLDFGLAKALDPSMGGPRDDSESPRQATSSPQPLSMSPTLTAQMTQVGVILGTAAYMSPEQASGKPADQRADIWAFGAVLYEMLTGKRLFSGETATELMAAVLHVEPDWEKLPPETPEAIRRLLFRCLRKDVSKRLQHIGEARIVLQGEEDPPAGLV